MKITRRNLLRLGLSAGTLGFAGRFGRFGMLNAMAQDPADYKALVCLFLYGGNDSNNTLVPLNTAEYDAYRNIRKNLALASANLLPVATRSGTPYGFHSRLPGMQQLFNDGSLAVVSNVGTLVKPVTRSDYMARTAALPSNLFSHLDQQTEWQTASPLAPSATGWAGRVADIMAPLNGAATFPAFVSVGGSALLGEGSRTHPGSVVPGQTLGLAGYNTTSASQARLQSLQEILTFDTGMTLVHAANGALQQGMHDDYELRKALAGAAPLTTAFPTTSIGQQLQQVARMVQVRQQLGMSRQIFFASLGGFDTHTSQLTDHDNLYGQISAAILPFNDAMLELGVAQKVTLFTESDFSRTFQPNSNGGTDHAWGSHHFVLGGAVRGGDLYGRFPVFALGGPDDAGAEGRWIPSVSVDQYAATLAAWFGVGLGDLGSVFPNLSNFPDWNVGFMA
jgi:uncharacterized protein (DUF1501 family)